MKRSAVFAGAMAAAIGSVDCGGGTTGGPATPAHDSGVDHEVIAPMTDYGIAVPEDADVQPVDAGSGEDVVAFMTDYGIAVPEDADVVQPVDAGGGEDVIAVGTDYGIAVPEDAGTH
jgi:hypothetical protein